MSGFLSSRLQAFAAYVPGEQPSDPRKLIKLNTNENPYPPSPRVFGALTGADIENLRLYSDLRCAGLRAALASHLGVRFEQTIVGNGSDELIYLAMMAFGGDGVVFPDITYGFYRVWAGLLGYPFSEIPLAADFTVDTGDYARNERMVILANPNAPTGVALPLEQIERVVRANPDRVVLVDEAYVDFGGQSTVSLIDAHDNLIVCRTFSKSRQMAGLRLGFALAGEPLIADMDKMRYSINPYNVNSLAQILGKASVEDDAYFQGACARVAATRDATAARLLGLGFTVLPSSANFVFARPPAWLPGADYVRGLRERGILVRRFDQDRIKDFARITIGTDAQMDALISATKEIVAK